MVIIFVLVLVTKIAMVVSCLLQVFLLFIFRLGASRCWLGPTFSAASAVLEALRFCRLLSRLLSKYISLLCKNTEQIPMKFVRGNYHHNQIKWLHFGQNWNRNKRAGYKKKFKSTSNRCWHLVNKLKKFTTQTTSDVNVDTVSH